MTSSNWTKKELLTPFPPAIEDVITAADSTIGTVIPILDAAATLLDVAKIFFIAGADPYAGLVGLLITEVENLLNDFFNTGAFQLIVDPTTTLGKKRNRDPKGVLRITPHEAVQFAIQAIDDEGDENRPQFSNSADISAFGLLVTAPDLGLIISFLNKLYSVWTIDDLQFVIGKLELAKDGRPKQSIPPDWQSIRFNSINSMAQIQQECNELLAIARGYLLIGDAAIQDLINLLARKVDVLTASLEGLQSLVQNLEAILGLAGVWVFDLPKGPGGNARLKRALANPDFNSNIFKINKYTFMLLYVGGGPTVDTVDNMRQLVV